MIIKMAENKSRYLRHNTNLSRKSNYNKNFMFRVKQIS